MSADLLLSGLLALALPAELDRLAARGGPTETDWDGARTLADALAAHGDILLFRGKTDGETARMFAGFVRAMAVMAWLPGGWTAFGLHVCAGVPDCTGAVCHTTGGIRAAPEKWGRSHTA